MTNNLIKFQDITMARIFCPKGTQTMDSYWNTRNKPKNCQDTYLLKIDSWKKQYERSRGCANQWTCKLAIAIFWTWKKTVFSRSQWPQRSNESTFTTFTPTLHHKGEESCGGCPKVLTILLHQVHMFIMKKLSHNILAKFIWLKLPSWSASTAVS